LELPKTFIIFAHNNHHNKYKMKTKEEITAEIAQGVRDATKQRAETEIARESALRTELEKEARASIKARKDKRASFYYKVSYLILTGSGVGGFSTLLSQGVANWNVIIIGIFAATVFAILADQTLKS